ncbi:hypothetical protein GBAR_LOCUS11864 [Geodia barretti]|nr:hypothetical protein GBAR_LOCUS11864 [Geodia barretti]
MLTEMEGVRVDLKMKDEEMCARETVLEQARTEGELTCASLKRVKQDLTREMTQCKTLEGRMGQISPANELFPDDNSEGGGEVEELRSRHREHMEAVQSLWKEQEAKKTEYESHVARLEPREREMNQMRSEFAAQRTWLVDRLEEMYELFTGREKPVSPLNHRGPVTPGGYRAATDQLVPTNDPILPTGYTIMDLFHPSNTFSLLPGIDPVGRPLTVQGNLLTGISIKGRGSLNQECGLVSEVAASFIVTLRIPNRGRLMVDDHRAVSIKVGDPAFEFIIRPYKDTKVTFESRKFLKSFLTVDQNAHLSVQEMPPDFSDIQFIVRVQRFVGPYTTQIMCPHGRPSIVNQLKDRSVVQLYSKATGIYLGLRVNGDVVGMTNADNDKTFMVYCDRGLGRVSLQSYAPPLLKLKMRYVLN